MPDRPTTPSSARPTTKDARRDAAREKARRMRELEARKQRRNRVLLITAGVVVLVLVIGAVAFAVTRSGGSTTAAATPPGVSSDGGVTIGEASAPHTVTIFQDYQCPICKQYETAVGPWLDEQVKAGSTKLEYRPISILDGSGSTTEYSTRSANAAFCAAGQEGFDFYAFNTAMYAQQPDEGGAGLTDNKLVSITEDAGAADIGSCIADRTYGDFVAKSTAAALAQTDADGTKTVRGTPTVFVDGALLANEQGGAPTQEQLATALGVTDAGSTPTPSASTATSVG